MNVVLSSREAVERLDGVAGGVGGSVPGLGMGTPLWEEGKLIHVMTTGSLEDLKDMYLATLEAATAADLASPHPSKLHRQSLSRFVECGARTAVMLGDIPKTVFLLRAAQRLVDLGVIRVCALKCLLVACIKPACTSPTSPMFCTVMSIVLEWKAKGLVSPSDTQLVLHVGLHEAIRQNIPFLAKALVANGANMPPQLAAALRFAQELGDSKDRTEIVEFLRSLLRMMRA